MMWSEFVEGLKTVHDTGRTQALSVETTASLLGLRMIEGSEADAGGVVLTTTGRLWYDRITDRENERLLEAYAATLGRVLTHDHRRGLL
jgi:hypothetical protein